MFTNSNLVKITIFSLVASVGIFAYVKFWIELIVSTAEENFLGLSTK